MPIVRPLVDLTRIDGGTFGLNSWRLGGSAAGLYVESNTHITDLALFVENQILKVEDGVSQLYKV